MIDNRGGEEVLLDVGGQDATEAFEDVGHSDEARQILEGMEKAKLKRVVCRKFSNHLFSEITLFLSGTTYPSFISPLNLPPFHQNKQTKNFHHSSPFEYLDSPIDYA